MSIAASARIHPTAIIDPQAEIGENVQIGPYCIIEGAVRIGADSILRSHVCLTGPLTMGRGNDVGIGCVLGERPQHLGYKNEETRTEIGDNNLFREHVTVHRGTSATGVTSIGSNNFFMAHCHVAHDCRVGNHVTMVNGTLIGGHCVLEDRSTMGGNAAIHQMTRLGKLSFLSGLASITKDLLPFMMSFDRNVVVGVNKIGMRRAGYSTADIGVAQQAYQIIYRGNLMQKLAVQKFEQEFGQHPVAADILTFIRTGKRGFIGPHHEESRETREAREAA